MFPNGRVQLLSILYFDEKYIQFYIYFCFLVYIYSVFVFIGCLVYICFYRLFGVYLFLSVGHSRRCWLDIIVTNDSRLFLLSCHELVMVHNVLIQIKNRHPQQV